MSETRTITFIPAGASSNIVSAKIPDGQRKPERKGLGVKEKDGREPMSLGELVSTKSISNILKINGSKDVDEDLIDNIDTLGEDRSSPKYFYEMQVKESVKALRMCLQRNNEYAIKKQQIKTDFNDKLKSVKSHISNIKVEEIAREAYNLRCESLDLPRSQDIQGEDLYIQPEIQARIIMVQKALRELKDVNETRPIMNYETGISEIAVKIWDYCRTGETLDPDKFINNLISELPLSTTRQVNTFCFALASARINGISEQEKYFVDACIDILSRKVFSNEEIQLAITTNIDKIKEYISGLESSKNETRLRYLEDAELIVRNRTGNKTFKFS